MPDFYMLQIERYSRLYIQTDRQSPAHCSRVYTITHQALALELRAFTNRIANMVGMQEIAATALKRFQPILDQIIGRAHNIATREQAVSDQILDLMPFTRAAL